MMHLFGTLAALVFIYIAISMIVVGKMPPRATGLLGLTLVMPTTIYLVESQHGFIGGFMSMLFIVALTALFVRLLIGKKLFSMVVVKPFRSVTSRWFNRSQKRMRDIW